MLQHESQKVNIVIHFEEQFDGLLFFTFFENFNNLFPLFDKHKVGVVGLKLILCGFLRSEVVFGVFLLLKGLEFFEIGYGFGLLPGDGLIVLDVVMGFGFVVDAFFDFFHFFGVGLLGGILFMIKVLNRLDIISAADACIFLEESIVVSVIMVLWRR